MEVQNLSVISKDSLKTVDTTIGSCQKLVFTVGVSQHMHKQNNKLVKILAQSDAKLRDINERKNTLVTHRYVRSDA